MNNLGYFLTQFIIAIEDHASNLDNLNISRNQRNQDSVLSFKDENVQEWSDKSQDFSDFGHFF